MTKEPDDKQSVTVRLPTAMVERIDAWGVRHGVVKRSDALRMLVTKALDADDDGKTVKLTGDQADRLDKAMRRLRAKDASEAIDQMLELLADEAPEPKPGVFERVVKSLVGEQSMSPAQRAAKRT